MLGNITLKYAPRSVLHLVLTLGIGLSFTACRAVSDDTVPIPTPVEGEVAPATPTDEGFGAAEGEDGGYSLVNPKGIILPQGSFLLESAFLKRCLAKVGNGGLDKVCANTADQRYSFLAASDGSYVFVNKAKGECVDVNNADTTDGNGLDYHPSCDITNNAQKWQVVKNTDATFLFRSKLDTTKCMEVPSKAGLVGTNTLQISTCRATANQKFNFKEVFSTMLVSQKSGRCLEMGEANSIDGEIVQQAPCSGKSAQSFEVKTVTSGTVEIRTDGNLCLGSNETTVAFDTPIFQTVCKAKPAQRWTIAGTASTGYTFTSVANKTLCFEMDASVAANIAMARFGRCTSAAERFKRVSKASTFVAAAPIVLTVAEKCSPKTVIHQLDLTANGNYTVTVLGEPFLTSIKNLSQKVCSTLYTASNQFNPPRYLDVYVLTEAQNKESLLAYVTGNGHRRSKLAINSSFAMDRKNMGVSPLISLRGVLIHELTHVFQNDPPSAFNDGTMDGLNEGIADAVRIKNNLADPTWGPSSNKSFVWNEGYVNTARFLFIHRKE